MIIHTNNVPRFTIDAIDLTPSEREKCGSWLDWDAIEAGTAGATFFRYRGWLYSLDEFMRTDDGGELRIAGWDGSMADTYFSGVVIRLLDDGERVIVGSCST